MDCTVESRRPKLAGNAIWFAEFEDWAKSDSGRANRGKVGPATALFCKQSQNGIPSAPTRPGRRGDEKSYKALLHQRSLASRKRCLKIEEHCDKWGPLVASSARPYTHCTATSPAKSALIRA